MTAVARAMFSARRHAYDSAGLIVVAFTVLLILLGQLSAASVWRGDAISLVAAGGFTIALARALSREVTHPSDQSTASRASMQELELGLLLLTGTYVLVALTGGMRSFLYPLVYALVSFLLIVQPKRWIAATWVAAACGLEVVVAYSQGIFPSYAAVVGYHITFIVFFAAGNVLVLSSLVRKLRTEHDREVSDELSRMRQEARDFRLISAQLPLASRSRPREEEELRMAQGAVQSIHEQMFFTLDLLRTSMKLSGTALIWQRNNELVIKELVTDSEYIPVKPELASPGLMAGVLKDLKPLRLKGLSGKRRPPYYSGPEPVTDFCAVPVMQQGSLKGVLCADRGGNHEFSEEEELELCGAASHLLRIVEQERVLAAVERGKYEQEQFFRASEQLNEALTVEDVCGKSFDAMGALAPYDLAALIAYDPHTRGHRVLAVRCNAEEKCDWGKFAKELAERRFDGGATLVSMAVKNRHHICMAGERLGGDTVVFEPSLPLKNAQSVLVLPLLHGDGVMGTIVLASRSTQRYGGPTAEMLQVIAHQVATSLQNARMYRVMEERATTDGLTGLTNHRSFQDRYEQLHALAERSDRKFSLLLTDIDHFKKVNDTYGHPAGDQVLKRVSAVLAGRARKVDVVARYGGEEFVLILPDTDGDGAELFANRLREEIEAQTITTEAGSLSVTMSMGIAEFPADGVDRKALIEKADQALYVCKKNGRNCVTRYKDM